MVNTVCARVYQYLHFYADTFLLYDGNGVPVVLRKNGIAWESDRTKKFKNPPPNAPGMNSVNVQLQIGD